MLYPILALTIAAGPISRRPHWHQNHAVHSLLRTHSCNGYYAEHAHSSDKPWQVFWLTSFRRTAFPHRHSTQWLSIWIVVRRFFPKHTAADLLGILTRFPFHRSAFSGNAPRHQSSLQNYAKFSYLHLILSHIFCHFFIFDILDSTINHPANHIILVESVITKYFALI